MCFTMKHISLQLNRASRHDTLVLSRAAGAPGESTVKEVKRPMTERTTPRCMQLLGKAVGHNTQAAIMRLALATRHRVERPAMSMEGGTVNPMERLPAAVCFAFD